MRFKNFLLLLILWASCLSVMGQATSTPFGPGGGSTSYIPPVSSGGGGGGGTFDTNADFIVNGTWKFTNKVYLPGHIYDSTDVLSISPQSRYLYGADGVLRFNWDLGQTYDASGDPILNTKTGSIQDSGSVLVLDAPGRHLVASDGGYFASFGTYTLNDNNSNPSLNSNTRTLRDDSNLNVLDWENRAIGTQGGTWTINGLSSVNLLTNLVASSAPFIAITGTGGHSYTITGVGTVVTNNASPTFGNTIVNGKILSSATTAISTALAQIHTVNTNQLSTEISILAENYGVTNIPNFVGRRARGTAASPSAVQLDDTIAAFTGRAYGATAFSALSKGSIAIHAAENWTDSAQGTYVRILTTPTGSTTVAERVRVDPSGYVGINTTTPLYPLDVNGTARLQGGLIVNRATKTVNYTNAATDYMIAWKGTTVAQPTNFLAAGGVNGQTYVIKDAQRSAFTTNIVIKPLSTDTIGGASSYILNVNGQAVIITYDGTSNWEVQ